MMSHCIELSSRCVCISVFERSTEQPRSWCLVLSAISYVTGRKESEHVAWTTTYPFVFMSILRFCGSFSHNLPFSGALIVLFKFLMWLFCSVTTFYLSFTLTFLFSRLFSCLAKSPPGWLIHSFISRSMLVLDEGRSARGNNSHTVVCVWFRGHYPRLHSS